MSAATVSDQHRVCTDMQWDNSSIHLAWVARSFRTVQWIGLVASSSASRSSSKPSICSFLYAAREVVLHCGATNSECWPANPGGQGSTGQDKHCAY